MNRRDWIRSAALSAGAAYVGRPAYAEVSPSPKEAPATSHGFLNLSINENQFGPSPDAVEAIRHHAVNAHEYPLGAQDRLKKAIALHEQVDPSQVILGAGSSDIIMGAASYYGRAGGSFVSSDPSFAPLMMWAAKFGVEHVKLPWNAAHGVDLDSIEKAVTNETKIAYVCNPENPVGTALDPDILYAFCRKVSQRCPVLVDEAYIDFAGDAARLSMMRCVREGMPVIVLRTFSKAYGLGGMRIGYAVTSREIAADLGRHYVTGIGCGCSHVSLEAAIVAYKDQVWLKKVRDETARSKAYVYETLSEAGYDYIPSVTTFVLVPVEKDSKQMADAIFGGFRIKISPRNYYGQNYLRLSMGTQDQMQQLAKALSYVL